MHSCLDCLLWPHWTRFCRSQAAAKEPALAAALAASAAKALADVDKALGLVKKQLVKLDALGKELGPAAALKVAPKVRLALA